MQNILEKKHSILFCLPYIHLSMTVSSEPLNKIARFYHLQIIYFVLLFAHTYNNILDLLLKIKVCRHHDLYRVNFFYVLLFVFDLCIKIKYIFCWLS